MSDLNSAPRKNKSSSRIPKDSVGGPKAGDSLEYRVVRLFLYRGFYVRRSRELYTVGYLDRATDLDVLAIRYQDPFRHEIQICECKSGSEGPLDRVFWLAGVKRYVDATHATLVRKNTKWNIKNFASEVGVEILDLPRLELLERGLGIKDSDWPGASDQSYFESRAEEWNLALRKDPALKELSLTLAGEVRFHEPFGGINYLLYQLRVLTRHTREGKFSSESLGRFLVAECVTQLAMFLMRVAEMCIPLSAEDQKGLIRKGMMYGNVDAKLTERIFRNAHRLTGEMIRHYTGKDVEVDASVFAIPEPPELAMIETIIQLLVDRPGIANTFVPMTDLLITERYLKQRESLDWIGLIFRVTDQKERLALCNEYLRLLSSVDAVPITLSPGRRHSSESVPEASRPVRVDLSTADGPLSSGRKIQDEHRPWASDINEAENELVVGDLPFKDS